jgi:hypothetical protein
MTARGSSRLHRRVVFPIVLIIVPELPTKKSKLAQQGFEFFSPILADGFCHCIYRGVFVAVFDAYVA